MKKIVCIVLALAFCFSVIACGAINSGKTEPTAAPAEQKTEEAKKWKFGFTAATMTNDYYKVIKERIEELVQGDGYEIICVDPQQDAPTQLNYINDLIQQDIDLLFLCPVDSTSIKSALEACKTAGIPVVNFDTAVLDEDLVETIIMTDNYQCGQVIAEDMMKRLPEGSKVAMTISPEVSICVERVNGFKETANGYFDIVSEQPCRGDTAGTMVIAEDVLQANPELDAFYGINDPAGIGICQAIKSQGREADGILVYSIDGQPIGKDAVKKGEIVGTAAQFPVHMAEQAVESAYKILSGEKVEKRQYTASELITLDNVDKYGVDSWQ